MTEYREGQTATNPNTGQKLVYHNGQWTNAGSVPPKPKPQTAVQDQATKAKIAALDALSRQLQTTRGIYNRDFKGQGIGSLMEYLPSQEASRFNSAAAGLSDQALGAFRVPGSGSQSDRELEAFVQANQPSNWDRDAGVEQKLGNIEGRLIPMRRAYGLPDQAAPLNAPAGPTRIRGDDDYARLPSGAVFIGPDGKQRRKP